MQVHPVADLFPMLSEDELADLAADIKAHGLVHPITLDATGEVLVDGRNRLKACEIARVKPEFERLNGVDATAFIVSANIRRRHLNAGQTAILLARAYPEREKGGRGKTVKNFDGIARQQIFNARLIEDYAPELGDQILAKQITFEEARLKARDRKAEAETNAEKMARLKAEAPDLADLAGISLDEAVTKLEKRKADAARLAPVRERSPDLAALVDEGRMTVMDACAAHDRRVEEDRAAREGATSLLARTVQLIGTGDLAPAEVARRLMASVDENLWPADALGKLTARRSPLAAPLAIERVIGIEGHAVVADRVRVAALSAAILAGVAICAQRLQRPEAEGVPIPIMGRLMVGDFRPHHAAVFLALGAQREKPHLSGGPSFPKLSVIPAGDRNLMRGSAHHLALTRTARPETRW